MEKLTNLSIKWKFRINCFAIVENKWLNWSIKCFFFQVQKKKKIKNAENMKAQRKQNWLYGHIKHNFCPISDRIIKTVFSKLLLLFSILGPKFSRNRCKLRRKLCNAKCYPLEVKISDFFNISHQIMLIYIYFFSFEAFKKHSPCAFFKDKLRLYVFESTKYLPQTPVSSTVINVNLCICPKYHCICSK